MNANLLQDDSGLICHDRDGDRKLLMHFSNKTFSSQYPPQWAGRVVPINFPRKWFEKYLKGVVTYRVDWTWMVCRKKNSIFSLRRPKKLKFQILTDFRRIWVPGAVFWPPEVPRPFYATKLSQCWVAGVNRTLKTAFVWPTEMHLFFEKSQNFVIFTI